MDTFAQDLRYAARKLLRAPGFTAIALLTLALGIGATTAIFSVVNGVLLRPLPFEAPERLVRIASSTAESRGMVTSAADFLDIREQNRSFAGIAAFHSGPANITGGGDPERVDMARVSASFFTVLGVRPALGRGFVAEEEQPGAERVVVLSDALWRRRYDADPSLVGRAVSLNGNPHTVVGIAPRGLDYPEGRDLWTPLVADSGFRDPGNRGAHWLTLIGRLKPGVTVEQASQEVAAIARRLAEEYPQSNTNFGGSAYPLQEDVVGNVGPALLVMLGAVGFVLLIACANVANLMLARAATRETEIAVRTALGAGRTRIVRQLVTESLLLAVVGGALGVLLAAWGVDVLVALGPGDLPRLGEVRIDGRVLGFSALVAIGTGVLFGLVPAVQASRPALNQMLKEGGRGMSGGPGARMRGALVVAEMALAVVLLVGAGLLVRSFTQLMSVDPGFRREQIVTFNLAAPRAKYGSWHRLRAFATELENRIRAVPGAQPGVAFGLPLAGWTMRTGMEIAGTPESTPETRRIVDVSVVTPRFFQTIGIPLVQGRGFTDEDRGGGRQVVVLNRTAARRYFPNQDAIGRQITIGVAVDTAPGAPELRGGGEVVGIVADVRQTSLGADPVPMVYVPFDQMPINDFSVVVRSSGDPAALAATIRAQLRELDPDLPIEQFRTLSEHVGESVSRPRFYALLLGAFAAIALVLAAVGIYGVLSSLVAQRTRELGIRVALGASAAQVLRLVMRRGLALTGLGVVLGIAASVWLGRLLESLLYGVGAGDPVTFAAVPTLLLAVAALACWLPARRAARVDPLVALRDDGM